MSTHGTNTRYCAGCRCGECRAANSDYRKRLREQETPEHLHGAASTYTNRGCRCDKCRAAWRDHNRESAALKSHRKATSAAAKWVRENRPDVWTQLLAAERSGVGS